MRRFGVLEAIAVGGLILTGAELALEGSGGSICGSEGCRVVASFARSEPLVVALGFLFWLVVFALRLRGGAGWLLDSVLTAGLAAEGYLVGFQLFVARDLCTFCLINAALVVTAGAVRLWSEDARVGYGFLAAAVLLGFTWLVNPGFVSLPKDTCTLIYSENCPHCHEVLRECSLRGIHVRALEVKEAPGLLKSLGVEEVPALICPGFSRIEVVCGAQEVLRKLARAEAVPGAEIWEFPEGGSGTCRIGEECR